MGFFCSLRDEPDTAEALVRWSAVKRIVVPRVEGDAMRFYRYDPQTLRPGAFGIAEPGPEAQACDPSEIAVKGGVCFAHQLVGELPAEPHDVAMDYLITD